MFELQGEAVASPDDVEYAGSAGQVTWRGVRLTTEVIDSLRAGVLPERLLDLVKQQELLAELQALATTNMGTDFITNLLSQTTKPLGWEIGEALAESILQERHGVTWPWNSARDKKTPKASLPGADLIGFIVDASGPALLFGEVKTSSDKAAPPGVVTGRHGLIHQLEDLAVTSELHWTLLRWLRPRCQEPEHLDYFKQAAQRFVSSYGTDFRLVGCLLRDTDPNELDLKNRGQSLATKVTDPTKAELVAWYVPEPIENWPDWMEVTGSD